MVDAFSILLTHGLMLVYAWRLLSRDDLDHEGGAAQRGFRVRRAP